MDWRHSHEGSWTTYESAVKDVNVGISPVNELENSCKVLFEIMQMQQQGGHRQGGTKRRCVDAG